MRREDWVGALSGLPRAVATEVLQAPIEQSRSGTAAFLGVTYSGKRYWIKPLGNPQGDQAIVTEQIVSAAGRRIGAPVRPTALVEIQDDVAGWEYCPGTILMRGIAHGSEHLADATEDAQLIHRRHDDNPARQPSLVALWDWCMGSDEQWLYDRGADRAVWSHDHGLWLTGETGWDDRILQRVVDQPWPMDGDMVGMDPDAFAAVADRITNVTEDNCIDIALAVPSSWPAAENDLEAVAWLLYRRREPVAARLRDIARSS